MAETTPKRKRLYFFWDYDITEEDLRAILAGEDEFEKAWAISRLLEAARWEDIWKYIRLSDVREWFPRVKLRPQIREIWAHALTIWSGEVSSESSLTPLQREFLREFFDIQPFD